jgi:hypothetical protein
LQNYEFFLWIAGWKKEILDAVSFLFSFCFHFYYSYIDRVEISYCDSKLNHAVSYLKIINLSSKSSCQFLSLGKTTNLKLWSEYLLILRNKWNEKELTLERRSIRFLKIIFLRMKGGNSWSRIHCTTHNAYTHMPWITNKP